VVAADRRVTWRAVPDPSGLVRGPLRFQLPEATRFRRGEGMWFDAGIVTPDRVVSKFVTADGRPERQHEGSEFCGPVFSTDGSRLYVTSQRGFGVGAIMEITGPFRTRRPGAGDLRDARCVWAPDPGRAARPARAAHRLRDPAAHPSEHAARGRPALLATLDEPAELALAMFASFTPAQGRGSRAGCRRTRTLASRTVRLERGRNDVRLRLTSAGREALRGRRQNLRVTIRLRVSEESVDRTTLVSRRDSRVHRRAGTSEPGRQPPAVRSAGRWADQLAAPGSMSPVS